MSDEEVDYMSEDFLSKCVGNNDIRPGLSHSYSGKRKNKMEMKKRDADESHRKRMKPIHEIQKEKLQEGLQTPIDASNKGFALMQKMGYKMGMSLGKQGNGIIEPVPVTLKSNRIGLGWEELLKEKKQQLERRKQRKTEKQIDPLEYRALKISQHNKKKTEADLNKSRKVCYDLDFKEGIITPHEFWFWPESTWGDEDEVGEYEDDDYETGEINNEEHKNGEINSHSVCDEPSSSSNTKDSQELGDLLEPGEQLQILTSYLRSTYLYCIWCGIEYEDNEDLENNCPGPTRVDHDD